MTGLAVFALAGCSNLLSNTKVTGSSLKNNKKTLTITVTGDEGVVSFKNDTARMILPSALDGEDLYFYYWGENLLDGSDMDIQQPNPITFYAAANTHNREGTIELDLPTSQYKLYLAATTVVQSIVENPETDRNTIKSAMVLYASSTVDMRYNERVSFYLNPYTIAGTGNVSLKIGTNWTIEAPFTNAGNITFGIYKLDTDVKVSDAAVKSLTAEEIAAMSNAVPANANFTPTVASGTYNLKVYFKNPSGKNYVWSDKIVILANQVTEATIVIPNIIGIVPAAPTLFTARYHDAENPDTGYYDVEFLWKDNANNEQFFQIDLMDITNTADVYPTDDVSWAGMISGGTVTAEAVQTFTNQVYKNKIFIDGGLTSNSGNLILSLPLGKRYYARICSVNDAGASAYLYQDLTIADGSGDGEIASIPYTRPGATATTSTINVFPSVATSINRFRVTYNFAGGNYFETTYDGTTNEVDTISDTKATQAKILSLNGTLAADVRYYTQTVAGNPLLNPLMVEDATDNTKFYSLAKGGTNWTNWKADSISGTTVYGIIEPSANDHSDARPLQELSTTTAGLAANYDSPYTGYKNLNLFAVYGQAAVSIYNPADYQLLDTDVLVFKNTTNAVGSAIQVATIDNSNLFTVNNNKNAAIGYQYVYIAVRNDNYAKVSLSINDQANGPRFNADGETKTSITAPWYKLTTKEPADFSTNYANYFTKSGRVYSAATSATWAANTIYYEDTTAKTENNFTYFTIPVTTELAPGSTYIITVSGYTSVNSPSPFTYVLSMKVVDNATPEYSVTTFEPLTYDNTKFYDDNLGTNAAPATWAAGDVYQKD